METPLVEALLDEKMKKAAANGPLGPMFFQIMKDCFFSEQNRKVVFFFKGLNQ